MLKWNSLNHCSRTHSQVNLVLKCHHYLSALLVFWTRLLCRGGNCLSWTSSNLTVIVLPNKGLPLPSNKCFEAHAGNVKLVSGEHKTGNNVIDYAICVTEWLLANNDKCSNTIHRGLEVQWKFRSGSLPMNVAEKLQSHHHTNRKQQLWKENIIPVTLTCSL